MAAAFSSPSHLAHAASDFSDHFIVNPYDWAPHTMYQQDEPIYSPHTIDAFTSPLCSGSDYDYSGDHYSGESDNSSIYNYNFTGYDSSLDGSSTLSSNGSGYPSPTLSNHNSPTFAPSPLEEFAISSLSLGIDHLYEPLHQHSKAPFHTLHPIHFVDPSSYSLNDMLATPIFPENKLYIPKLDAGKDCAAQAVESSPLVGKTLNNLAQLDAFVNSSVKVENTFCDSTPSTFANTTLLRRNSSPASSVSSRGSLTDAAPIATTTPIAPSLTRRKSAPPYAQNMHSMNLSPPKPRKIKQNSPYKCQFEGCEKTFTRPYNLKSHMRTHTSERPYPCSFPGCEKTFSRQHDRNRHAKLHLGIKPYVCQNCQKAFARQDALNRHLRVENGPCALALQSQVSKFKSVNL